MSPLTIILPIKDRHDFVRRFLDYADKHLPYRVLVADGSKEEFPHFFPSGFIEYIRYPYDETLSRYHAKMADIMRYVETPYAMLADDDGFVLRSGTDKAIEFLDNHPDYVCCGGGNGGFALFNNGAEGRINRWSYRYTYLDRSFDCAADSAMARLAIGSRNWWSYYAVYRTNILRDITREVKEIDFSDLQLREFYYAMRTLTLGKAYSDPTTIGTLRQYRVSMSDFEQDWVHRLLRSRFNSDLKILIDKIASYTENPEKVRELLLVIFEDWLIEFLNIYYGSLQSVKQKLRDRTPRFYNWLKNHKRFGVGRERIRLFENLHRDGASTDYLTEFRSELETITNLCA